MKELVNSIFMIIVITKLAFRKGNEIISLLFTFF